MSQLPLRQSKQKIRLILGEIHGAQKIVPARLRVPLDASVVACGNARCADLPCRHLQLIEFHVIVAKRARNRGTARQIILHEWAHDGLLEAPFEIDDVMGNADMLGNAPGVIDVVKRTAALRRGCARGEFRKAALVPELHR